MKRTVLGQTEIVADATNPIVCLEIIQWGFSLGGEHFTGSVWGYRTENECDKVEITHPLSAKEAAKLNKKDGTRSFGRYRKGQSSNRFETQGELERAAIRQYKSAFPKARALIVGRFAVANAQRCIDGPRSFMKAVNLIVNAQERRGGYERNPKEVDCLLARYNKLVKALKAPSV